MICRKTESVGLTQVPDPAAFRATSRTIRSISAGRLASPDETGNTHIKILLRAQSKPVGQAPHQCQDCLDHGLLREGVVPARTRTRRRRLPLKARRAL